MGPDTPTAVAASTTPAASGTWDSAIDLPISEPAGEVRAVKMPLVDRVASAVVTGAPPILVGLGMWLGWSQGLLVWQDLLVLAIFYMVIGSGITVGFHRLLTHRSFKCHRLTRAIFAALGSAAAEGPVIDWVATQRNHHQI
jgi:stearoyl-CoA desaturase (delta-9 desaturase)